MRGLPPGIRRRHSRACPAYESDDAAACRCRPSYQAQAGPRRGRLTSTFATLAAARAWKRDVERATAAGELAAARPPVLRDAAEEWLMLAERGVALARGDRPYRASTLRGYRLAVESHLFPVFGGARLDELSRGQLNRFVEGLQARGLAAQTVRNVVVPLRALYRRAVDMEVVSVNPTVGMRMPAGSGRRLEFLEPGEIAPVLDALAVGDRVLWATAIYAGLRRGELMALRWADVDLAGGVVTVSRSYDAPSRQTGRVKSLAGQDRRVPIAAVLRDHLLEHRQRSGARSGLVFARGLLGGVCRAGTGEMPFADRPVSTRARAAWMTAGVRPVTLHACRHTFASLMIASQAAAGTFNPKVLQQMLGHSSIAQTYDRYGHLFPGAELEAARHLDRFLEASAPAAGVALPSVALRRPDGVGRAVLVPRSSMEGWR